MTHPQCRRCKKPMLESAAIVSTLTAGSPDFPSDTKGITLSPGGPGKLVDCWKCPQCGHSITR